VSDYTNAMFRRDYEKVLALLLEYRDKEKLAQPGETAKPEYAVMDMVKYFAEQYGNSRGTDYHMRFLSVMQFIEHYQKELVSSGFLTVSPDGNVQLPDSFLDVLLNSIKPPQPPSRVPSAPLYNQDRQFNYKKVIKALKPG
jgi:hypothetical protein